MTTCSDRDLVLIHLGLFCISVVFSLSNLPLSLHSSSGTRTIAKALGCSFIYSGVCHREDQIKRTGKMFKAHFDLLQKNI